MKTTGRAREGEEAMTTKHDASVEAKQRLAGAAQLMVMAQGAIEAGNFTAAQGMIDDAIIDIGFADEALRAFIVECAACGGLGDVSLPSGKSVKCEACDGRGRVDLKESARGSHES